MRTLDNRDPFEDALPGLEIGDDRPLRIGDHVFRLVATERVGCHSGRRRYRVECLTCGVVVHPGSTGPGHMARRHLRDLEEGYDDPLLVPIVAAGDRQAC